MANFGLNGWPRGRINAERLASGGVRGAIRGRFIISPADSIFSVTPGQPINQNDLVTLDEDGLAYPVRNVGHVLAPNVNSQTLTPLGLSTTETSHLRGVETSIQFADGSFVFLTMATSPHRLVLTRVSAAGAMVRQITINETGATLGGAKIGRLNNGNIVCFWHGTSRVRFAIVTEALDDVVPVTEVESVGFVNQIAFAPLANGGFAAAWGNSNPFNVRLGIWSNAGVPVAGFPATIQSGSGADALTGHIIPFSNGNFAVLGRLATANDVTRFGIFSPSGAAVLAWGPWSLGSQLPVDEMRIVRIGTRTLIAAFDSADSRMKLNIMDEAGARVGAELRFMVSSSTAVAAVAHEGQFVVVAQGHSSEGRVLKVIRIPADGVAVASDNIPNLTTASAAALGSNTQATIHSIFVVDQRIIGAMDYSSGTRGFFKASFLGQHEMIGNIGTGSSDPVRVWPFGVGGFLAFYLAGSAYTIMARRFRAAAIQGVALLEGQIDQPIPIVTAPGIYAINPMPLLFQTDFNHNATTLLGQRGTVMGQAVRLNGYA